MRYSISGTTTINEEDYLDIPTELVKDVEDTYMVFEYENGHLNFEIWVETEEQKDILFNDLRAFIKQHSGLVAWHECSHWEEIKQPCVIAEEYRA